MSTNKTKFTSEGFDLSAATNSNEGVVYEIGGGVTHQDSTSSNNINQSQRVDKDSSSPMYESERLKGLGNDHFKKGNHLDAYDYYTEAIEACPYGEGIGPTGSELLKLREEFEEQNREKMMERQRKEMEKRRSRRTNSSNENQKENKEENNDDDNDEEDKSSKEEEATFDPPRHLYGSKLAVYYANRAATLLHLGRDGEAIADCDISTLLNPTYVKAYLRRSTANERIENTEEALRDAQRALELEPSNTVARKNVARLQKLENERLEKLKEETMGKLKDLGNSLLGNFGLSLDNFNAVQDPKTGGYSISFNQNK